MKSPAVVEPCVPVCGEQAGGRVPRHVAVILDGNRRWARAHRRDLAGGYGRGGEKVREVLGWCERAGIGFVTLWALSLDNLRRPEEEVTPILDAVVSTVEELAAERRWRIRPVGHTRALPAHFAARLRAAAEATTGVPGPTVNIAVAYGGRQELLDAVNDLLATEEGRAQAQAGLTEELLGRHLYTRGQPDPELIIRTSGEQRLSGFMPWQSAYSELYFCDVPWPDFEEADLHRALEAFASRSRRFGR